MTLQSVPRLAAGLVAAALIALAGTAHGAAPLPAGTLTADGGVAAAASAQPQRLAQRVDESALAGAQFLSEAEAAAIAPLHTDFDKVRPGQLILVTIPGSGTYICTLSFLYKDNQNPVNYYASTAGHCLLPSWGVSTHGAGANYNPSGVVVNACWRDCYFGGQLSGFIFGQFIPLGTVAYARQTQTTAAVGCVAGDVGNDFGLVKINPFWYTGTNFGKYIETSMAVWHGPYAFGFGLEGTGLPVVHHGNGIQLGTVEPTKARAGVTLNDGVICSWGALIAVAGGDSGSAVSIAATSPELVVSGAEALGTLTHALAGNAPPGYGTTVVRGINMAAADVPLTISMCMAGTTIAGC